MTAKTRVYDRTGAPHVRTLGTNEPDLVEECVAFVRRLRKRRRWEVLDLIIAGKIRVVEAWEAHEAGTLASVVATLNKPAPAPEADLSALVSEWDGQGRHGKVAKYVTQVRRMIPAGTPYPVSTFTRGAVKRFLDGLTKQDGKPSDPATKTRYRAALLQFGSWLVQRDLLPANPVRETHGYGKKKRPPNFLEPAQVKALVGALPAPFKALEALMAGTGMEWQAVERALREDVDLEHHVVHAKGGKNTYRDRYCEVSEDWAWAIVKAHVETIPPGAPLFTVSEGDALKAHHAAAKKLKLPKTVLHTHRHSFAVMHIRRWTDHQWIKTQLGHAPHSTLLYTTYGVYIQQAEMLKRRQNASNPATTPETEDEVNAVTTMPGPGIEPGRSCERGILSPSPGSKQYNDLAVPSSVVPLADVSPRLTTSQQDASKDASTPDGAR